MCALENTFSHDEEKARTKNEKKTNSRANAIVVCVFFFRVGSIVVFDDFAFMSFVESRPADLYVRRHQQIQS